MVTYYLNDISSRFDFGKHEGLPLFYVLMIDPSYVYWCVNNIECFFISETCLTQIREMFPKFIVVESFMDHVVGDSEDDCLSEDDDCYYDDYDSYDYISQFDDEGPTYERYCGSYAQDEMGYSDDEIDTIFEGDPDAYWNID